MRAANSTLFGGSEEIGTLKDAITRLGTRNLLFVALAQQATSFFRDAGAGYGLEEAEAWEGALAGAVAAELIATRSGVCDPGMAFTAALLRDCGKIAMDQFIGIEELNEVFSSPGASSGQIELECDSFGFDHAEVGMVLAGMWGLPEPLAEAIGHHHTPDLEAEIGLSHVVYAADLIAAQLGYGVGLDGLRYSVHQETLDSLGIDRLTMGDYLADVECRMDQYRVKETPDGSEASGS